MLVILWVHMYGVLVSSCMYIYLRIVSASCSRTQPGGQLNFGSRMTSLSRTPHRFQILKLIPEIHPEYSLVLLVCYDTDNSFHVLGLLLDFCTCSTNQSEGKK